MVKVIRSDLGTAASKRARNKSAVVEKRTRDTAGKVRMLRTIDANSPTFGPDLLYVFGKNVAKARRENKRVIGTTDIAIPKR